MAEKVIGSLANSKAQSYDKEFITRLSSYRPYIKPLVDNYPQQCLGQLSTLRLDIRANMKTAT